MARNPDRGGSSGRKRKQSLAKKIKAESNVKMEELTNSTEVIHDSAMRAGMKRKTSNRSVEKKSKVNKNAKIKEVTYDNDDSSGPVVHKRIKRAAACSNFKEKPVRLSKNSSTVETKRNRVVEEEMLAVELTKLGPEDLPPCRKLIDFLLHDADGNPQPFEMSEIDDIFITALIMPVDDNLAKERERGIKCEAFGRVENWTISGYDEGTPVVWVSTESADYECVKPASNYRKFYDLFLGKAYICVEAYRKLARSAGGNPNMSLEELLAGVIRSVSGKKCFSFGVVSRDFVISLGEFVYNQLIGLDETSGNDDVSLVSLPALVALREECINRSGPSSAPTKITNGSLKIDEVENLEASEDDDAKLARLLQEEEEWKLMKQQKTHRHASSQKNIYIKISEAEIANDYPLPAYYKPSVEEMDEFIFFETEINMSYLELPRRILNNWALYNSDSRLISLELLPMKPCAEIDAIVFGSGNMREDDGSGFCSELDLGQSSSTSDPVDEGVPIYLSAVKEWMIEFGSSMIFVSIRTDVAWYRLGKPTKQYAPWYEPILKTAKLAISIITLLKEQSRVSKLSFVDVIKKVSEFNRDHPAYISSNLSVVENYVVVHGQIILQQFAEYPDDTVRKCAFVSGLAYKMEQKHHTKLVMKKKVVLEKEANLNPSASMGPILSKRRVMRATTTNLINKIWGDYYNYYPEDFKEEETKGEEVEEEQDENEDEGVDDENILTPEDTTTTTKSCSSSKSRKPKISRKEAEWEGEPIGKKDSGETLYKSAIVRGEVITVGGAVMTEADESEEVPPIFYLEYMFENSDGRKMMHGRTLLRGSQTVLGNAAKERELFLTKDCMEFELGDVKESVILHIRKLPWGHTYRKENIDTDKMERQKAEERNKKGLPLEYYCKSLYWPERGAFFSAPFDCLGLGTGVCDSCNQRNVEEDEFKVNSESSFNYNKTEYNVNDFVYASPQYFGGEMEDDHGTFKGGRNVGLKAYVVCQLLEITVPAGSKQPTPKSTSIKVKRFYRPEDVSAAKAYCSDVRELYYSEDTLRVSVEVLEGKCEVRRKSDLPDLELPVICDHVFFCECYYDSVNGAVKKLPANVKFSSQNQTKANTALRKK